MKKSDGRACLTERTAMPKADLDTSGPDGRMELRTVAARGSNITVLAGKSGVLHPVRKPRSANDHTGR